MPSFAMIFLIIFATMVAMSFLFSQRESINDRKVKNLNERRIKREIEAIEIGKIYIKRKQDIDYDDLVKNYSPETAKVVNLYYDNHGELMVTYINSKDKNIIIDHCLNFVLEYRRF